MLRYSMIGILLIFQFACTDHKKGGALSEDEAAHELAMDLSAKVPQLHPDSTRVLVATSYFKVTTADVVRMIQYYLGDLQHQIINRTDDEIRVIIGDNARNLAEKKLILHDAQRNDVTVSQSEIDTVMNKEYREWGGEKNYRRSLSERKLSYDYILEDLRNGLIINKYFHEIVDPHIQVSEEQMRDRFENYYRTLRHILLTVTSEDIDDIAQVREKMEKIRERAVKGEDFAKLAQEYSEDPQTKLKGGLLKDLVRGIMPTSFEEVAFSASVGQVSDILETGFGFHILEVESVKPLSDSFEKSKNIIREQLIREFREKFYQEHVAGLKQQADYQEYQL